MLAVEKQQNTPGVEFVRTEFGWTIRFRSPDARYLAPTLADAKRAFADAKRRAELEASTR